VTPGFEFFAPATAVQWRLLTFFYPWRFKGVLSVRTCDVCGEPMKPQTGRGGRRKRHQECSPRQRPAAADTLPGSTREAVESELRAAGLLGRPESLAALSIAARLDAGDQPGAAHAALSKELRAVLADLRRVATPAGDIFDQLAARRTANERAAGGA
jgi:hypothetical protein